MSTAPFAKIYRRIMGQALSAADFQLLRGDFWRIRDRTLHVVTLHKSNPWNFTGDFAIQPLIYPFDAIALTLGDRVDEAGPGRRSWWDLPEDREGIERVVQDYAETVLTYVVPWLDRFQTCRDVVEADLEGRWGLRRLHGPTTQSKAAISLGLCALACDMPDAARSYLEFARKAYRRHLSPDSSEWFKADWRLVEEYLTMLSQEDWQGIRRKLAEGEVFTRRSLGLPPATDTQGK